ncbi:MAG: hypothetical protein JRJ42_02825 [Deltaproteobacteria bacterium]|nr:hypothetical protein [Deltaproteobacteria bacterium]RLB81468.1 MAG: hypothetical protein DRH17_08975 [Deltaproteobacteria bacterium]
MSEYGLDDTIDQAVIRGRGHYLISKLFLGVERNFSPPTPDLRCLEVGYNHFIGMLEKNFNEKGNRTKKSPGNRGYSEEGSNTISQLPGDLEGRIMAEGQIDQQPSYVSR